tara:strand:- start:1570 stop:1692 length:123 start_codon:yes stop_codon:yes gene_type:complete
MALVPTQAGETPVHAAALRAKKKPRAFHSARPFIHQVCFA